MSGSIVDFLVIGTQRGGTTALARFLSQHPDIYMSSRKELHFFDEDAFFVEPGGEYDDYHRQFIDAPRGATIGEATPIYMYWPTAPDRIKRYNPKIKLIAILRDPRRRAYSHWAFERSRGAETLPFSLAIRLERFRTRSLVRGTVHRVYSYVDRGFYSQQVRRLLALFDREQMLFLRSEDLLTHHDKTLETVCKFLGIRRTPFSEHEVVFPGDYPLMWKYDWLHLTRLYSRDVEELESILDWHCDRWKDSNLETDRR